MAKADRLERLTDLVLVLLNAPRPLSLETIGRDVPGYPAEHDARRQAFERDKRLLREEGIPVATEAIGGQEQFGYRIDPEAFYLPDLGLDPEEQTALSLAVAGVHLGDPSGRYALLKLGSAGVAEARPVASIVPPAGLPVLYDAIRTGAEVTFAYRGEPRRGAPRGLRFHGGRWYLAAWDLDRADWRTFRVDRIEGEPLVVAPRGPRAPLDGRPPLLGPWGVPEDDEEAVLVRVDSIEARRVAAEVGDGAVVRWEGDGSVVLSLGVSTTGTLRSWVLGLLDHAEVLGPEAWRQQMVAWLEALAAQPARSTPARSATTDLDAMAGAPPARAARPQAAGRDARQRLRRLLAIVGWLARAGEVPISDIATRFGLDEGELVRELELAACCGLPPYSPDVLMEIVVTDDTVQAFLPAELSRPRRLTPAEGLALAAAARTILAVPGADEDGALARALAKLETTLGAQSSLVVDLDEPPLLEVVRGAVAGRQRLEITYHASSTDETTRRVVDPDQVVALDGHWYLDAYCHAAADTRRFRVDRILELDVVGPQPPDRPLAEGIPTGAFVAGPDATAVRLELDAEAAWVLDSLPISNQRLLPGNRHEVVLAVGGAAWLDRLLLQLGPHARVLEPPALAEAGPNAARRVLRRYDTERA